MVNLRVISLVLCLTVGPAIANQYLAATTKRIELTSYIDDPELMVSVVAEIAATNKVDTLESLTVKYEDLTIRVPRKILDFAPNPELGSLELFYCGRSAVVFVDEDGNEIDRWDPSDEPCLLVQLRFSDQPDSEYLNWKPPYISVGIIDGKISGFKVWRFDGETYQAQSDEELGIYKPF